MALKSDSGAKKSKDQLSRDFWGRSIFDFCNNICQKATFGRGSLGLFNPQQRTSEDGRRTSELPTGDIAPALLWPIFVVKTWRSRAKVEVNTTFLVRERYGRLSTPCLRT
jgi:hypothetical protein